MNDEQAHERENPYSAPLSPLEKDPFTNEPDQYAARLLAKSWLRRSLLVRTPDGTHEVTYIGIGHGERVLVDGVEVARSRNLFWPAPRLDFQLGALPASAEIVLWPWQMVRGFALVVDGRPVYGEGSLLKAPFGKQG